MKFAFLRNAFVQLAGMFDVIFKFTVGLGMSRDKAAGRGARRTPASLTQAIEENSIWHRLKRTLLLPVALCLLRAAMLAATALPARRD
jgi:hypothetical protein